MSVKARSVLKNKKNIPVVRYWEILVKISAPPPIYSDVLQVKNADWLSFS